MSIVIGFLVFLILFLAIMGKGGGDSRVIRGKRKYKNIISRVIIWKDDDL